MKPIEYYFEPEKIAVIGASANENKPGYTLLKNIRDSFNGDVYPVNPTSDEILGMKSYGSVSEISTDIDLASILVPAPKVPDIVQQSIEKNAKAIFIGSEGFADVDENGKELQEKVVKIANEGGARVWGPNCGGYLSSDPDISNDFIMDTEGHIDEYLGGNVSFIGQSGMIAGGIYVELISEEILDISKTLTIGNRADVAEPDLLEYLKDDEQTDVIGIYQESVKDGRDLQKSLSEISPDKPVVILKGGRSDIGAEAAKSHTGSVAGDDRMADAIFRQFGATRVDDFRQLIDVTKGFSMNPKGMNGNRVAILTMTGAGSVVASDLFSDYDLELAELQEDTKIALEEVYPDWMEPQNPVDIWLSTTQYGIDKTLTTSLEAIMEDDSVDGVLFQTLAFDYFNDFDFDSFVEIAMDYDKPVVTWLVGEKDHTPYWTKNLEEGDIPVYRDMSSCVRFLGAAHEYAQWRSTSDYRTIDMDSSITIPKKSQSLLKRVKGDNRTTLTEKEAKDFLSAWDIPVTVESVASDEDEAVSIAEEIGYPVVLKISSSEILHKSDSGGLELNIQSEKEVREAYNKVIEKSRSNNPGANIDGVLVQEMVPEGRETIVGVKNDPEFGPMVLFGLGGIFVETLEDVSLRAAPISEYEAREMIEEIDGYPILTGSRGAEPADIDAVVDVLVKISELASVMDDEINELDVNPLTVFDEGEGVKAVDALIDLKS